MHSTNRLPPLEGLTALLAAADAGSFSGAAEALGLTHGSVSRRITVLEAWLGTSLFERHGRGVRLTPAGQRFAAETRRTLEAFTMSAEHWRPRRGRQTVTLTVVPSFARIWLLPRLSDLEGSDIHVDMIIAHRASDLDAREADIAIRYGRGGWSGIAARELFAETLAPVVNRTLFERIGAEPAVDELLQQPLLHDSDISQWRAWLAHHDVRYRPRWQDRRFEDYDTVLAAAEAGLGVALLRQPLAARWVREGRLFRVSGGAITNPAKHFICMRANETRGAVLSLCARLADVPLDPV